MSDDELERLRTIRRGHRGVTTKIVKEVDELLASGELIESEQLSWLNVKLQQLDGKLKLLSDIDKEILSKCNVDAIEQEINESESVTDKIMSYKQRIQEAIKGSPETAITPAIVPHVTATSSLNQPKLPKLTLPKFRGDLTSWTGFWDSFKSTVHENNAISKVDKFSYLKSLLEGTAARSIQGLTLSEANYDAAVTMLQDRFRKPQQIRNNCPHGGTIKITRMHRRPIFFILVSI